MNSNNCKFESLFLKAQEGIITEPEAAEFNLLLQDPANQKIYFELIKLNCALRQLEVSDCKVDTSLLKDNTCDIDLLIKLARGEKTTPVLPSAAEPIAKRKRLSLWLLTIPASIAALFLIAFSIQFMHTPSTTPIPADALLADSINAIWSSSKPIPQQNSAFYANTGPYSLREGYIELQFASDSHVTIEAPAKFEVLSDNKINLINGRIYARVPKQAIGFSVTTPKCNIVDLGTEFGVQVDSYGVTELHVSKGKTIVSSNDNYQSLEVAASSACIIDEQDDIKNITCQENLFVRDINPSTGMIWKGNTNLNLADIVGGGNGWGSNTFVGAINPETGALGAYNTSNRDGSGHYARIQSSPHSYIDGVFVPKNAAQVVTSQGHVFHDCPETNELYYAEIVNDIGLRMYDTNNVPSIHKVDEKSVNLNNASSIVMHSNSGITFDLAKIRNDLPDGSISKFSTFAGLSLYRPTADQRTSYIPRNAKAQVWVLIDGEVVFSSILDQPGSAKSIEINIPESARFLTLVATDGADSDGSELVNIENNDSDWCIFAQPELTLAIN